MADGFSTDDMLGVYLFENQQLLEKLQGIVLNYKDAECFDEDAIHEIFRTMHTMKASSGFMMHDNISAVSHKLEDIFAVLRDERPVNVPHLELVDHVLLVVDYISGELKRVEDGEALTDDAAPVLHCLDEFLHKVQAQVSVENKETKREEAVSAQKFYIAPQNKKQEEEEPLFVIDLESSVEEIEARVARTQEKIMIESKFKALEPGDFVIDSRDYGRAKQFVQEKPQKHEVVTYIKVDVTKVNHLVNLMEKLERAEADVLENPDLKVPGLQMDSFDKASLKLKKISGQLHDVIMSMRMVNLESTFQKLNRLVFDASRKLGKDVDFVVSGEELELDRSIVEQISDPLTHLVRNAIDHGIEMPEERIYADKFEQAWIKVSAYVEGDYICITVADNGKGLDRSEIIEKARQQGLLQGEQAKDTYTDKEIFQLITMPGFSTKKEVTEYSGRGVGMDVVVSNLAFIGGSLEIESEKGIGSRMTIKIPLATACFMEA